MSKSNDRKCSSVQNWYVVACKPSRELLAKKNLENQNFSVFLPLRRKTNCSRGNLTTRHVPLFAGYIFVHMIDSAARWRSINGTVGVKHLISSNGRALPLPRGIIDSLQANVDVDGVVDHCGELCHGDSVEIMAGPLAGQVGELLSQDDNGRVTILLQILSGQVVVRAESGNLLPA